MAASPDRVEAMLAALGALDVLDPTAVYWAGRLTLCGGPDDLDRYDAAFAAFFAGEAPAAHAGRTDPRPAAAGATPRRWSRAPGRPRTTATTPDLATRASADEVLRHRDVAELTVAEREHLRRLFALLRPGDPDAARPPAPAAARRAPSTRPGPCGGRCATAAR